MSHLTPKTFALLAALATLTAGCVTNSATDPVDGATVTDGGMMMTGPTVTTIEGDINLAVAVPTRSVNSGGAFSTPVTINETVTGLIVDAEWTASTPASQKLSVWVRDAAVGALPPSDPADLVMTKPPVASVTGTSPLRLSIPKEAFEADGDYLIIVRAAQDPAGVAVAQPFTLHVALFDGVAFDEAYVHEAAEE